MSEEKKGGRGEREEEEMAAGVGLELVRISSMFEFRENYQYKIA